MAQPFQLLNIWCSCPLSVVPVTIVSCLDHCSSIPTRLPAPNQPCLTPVHPPHGSQNNILKYVRSCHSTAQKPSVAPYCHWNKTQFLIKASEMLQVLTLADLAGFVPPLFSLDLSTLHFVWPLLIPYVCPGSCHPLQDLVTCCFLPRIRFSPFCV